MKNLFSSLVIAAILTAIGCQENTITDPIKNDSVDKVNPGTHDTYIQGKIPINATLNDPYPVGNSFYRISGQIAYDLRILYVDPPPSAPQQYISVHMQIDADLVNICTVCPPSNEDELSGFISETSEELVPMDVSQVSIIDNVIENSYLAQGREDRMTLKIRFFIDHKRVQINAMWLALPNSITDATENK
jgi:hypothetical protein